MKNYIKIAIISAITIVEIFSQTPEIQIDGSVNIAELLCFQPNTHDISGETAVRVKLSENIKKKIARYNWTIGNYGIKLLNAKQESVNIQSVNPGLSSVKYEAFDINNLSLGKVEIPLSVPQFVFIFENDKYDPVKNALPKGIDTSKARTFDEVLKYAKLQPYKKEIYKNAKIILEKLYTDLNIRFIWVNNGETMPNSVNKNFVKNVHINGFARDYGLDEIFESNYNATIGLSFRKNAFVTMGRVADLYTVFAFKNMNKDMAAYQEIMYFLKDKTIQESRKTMVLAFWKEVFYKIFAFAIAHEIGHTLLPAEWGHTDTKAFSDDMMSNGYDDLDIGLMKKDKIDWRTFPLPGTYKWGPMKGLNKHNLSEIQKMLPIATDLKFKQFFSLEN